MEYYNRATNTLEKSPYNSITEMQQARNQTQQQEQVNVQQDNQRFLDWKRKKASTQSIANHENTWDNKVMKYLPNSADNFMLGTVKGLSEYGASISKLVGSDNMQNRFNDVRRFTEQKIKKNDGAIGAFVGEMIGDPLNFTPAGLITKGTKGARVAKSMVAGAGVGAGTMLAKTYGNDDKTQGDKFTDMAMGAGFVSVLNGIIAGVTKGRIDGINPNILNNTDGTPKNTQGVIDALSNNAEALGLNKNESQAIVGEIIKHQHQQQKVQPEFAKETPFPPKPYEPNFQMRPNYPPAPMTRERALDVIFRKANQEAIARGEQPLYPTKLEDYQAHPRYNELMDMRRDISAKQTVSPQVLEQKRTFRDLDGNGGTSKIAVDGATYRPNYDADFVLTKRDIAKIERGELDDTLRAKIQQDLETFHHHPTWNKENEIPEGSWKEIQEALNKGETPNLSKAELDEADQLFAMGSNTLGGALGGGTLGGATTAYEDIVEGKDRTVYDYLRNIALGAVGGATVGKFAGKAEPKAGGSTKAGMFVGSKPTEKGAFSDVATKQTMREIDDSKINYKPIKSQEVEFDGRYYDQNYGKLSEIIDHPELFAKYPELKNMQVSVSNDFGTGGSYSPAVNSIQLNKGNTRVRTNEQIAKRQERIRELNENPIDDDYARLLKELQKPNMPEAHYEKAMELLEQTPTQKRIDEIGEQIISIKNNISKDGSVHLTNDGRDTLLHEIQHAIQEKENWARGGNADNMYSISDYFVKSGKEKRLNELEAIPEKELSGKEKWEMVELQRLRDDAFEEIDTYKGDVKYNKYRSLWGEQQARATAYRAKMTPEQRAKESMWDTLKREEGGVPESTVRYDHGTAMMSPVKSKEQKEMRGIYNVTFNGKNATEVRKADSEAIIKYEQGYEDKKTGKGLGALHIEKHLEDGSKGELSREELLQLGNIIRNGTIRESYGKNVYELNVDGVKFTAVTGSTKNGKERVITYYSDRNLEVDAHSKGAITSTTSNENIIPQNTDKLLAHGSNTLGGALGGGTLGGASTAYEDIVEGKEKTLGDYAKNIALGALGGATVGKLAGKSEPTNGSVKAGMFGGTKPNAENVTPTPKKESKIFGNSTDTLEKLATERANKDWGEITQNNGTFTNVKNSFKELFTDTFSGKYHEARDVTHTNMQKKNTEVERLAKVLDDLDDVADKELYKYLTGQENNLSDKIKGVADNMRKTIDDLGAELVRGGVLSEKTFKEWAGVYLHRQYEPHMNPTGNFKKGFKIDKMHERGISDTYGANDLKGITGWLNKNGFLKDDELVKFGNVRELRDFLEKTGKAGMLKEGKVGITVEPDGKIKLRRDFTQKERQAMGEIESAKIAIPNTIMKLNRMIEHSKFLKRVESVDGAVLSPTRAKEFSSIELEKAGYTKVNGEQFGALNGQIVRNDVADDIGRTYKDIASAHNDAFRVWNEYHGLWKKSKTVWNPTAHVNNYMGNLFLMHLGGVNSTKLPKILATGAKQLKAYQKLENLEVKMLKGQLTANEKLQYLNMKGSSKIVQEAKEMGVFGRSQLNDILSGMENKAVKKGVLSKVDKFAEKAYQFEDDFNRLSFYLTLRESGKDAKTAKQMIDFMLPDYSKPLPKGWRFLRDTSITPFISWSYYTMPSIVKMLGTKEGAVNATKVIATISAIEYALTGGTITPMDNIPFMNTNKPEDFKGRRFAVGKNGDKIDTVKLDRMIPYAELQNIPNYLKSNIGGMFPNLLYTMNGSQMYNGRPITTKNKDTSDKAIDWIKHLANQYTPVPAPVMSGINLADKELRGKERTRRSKTIEPRTLLQSLAQIGGVNTLTYNKTALKKEQKD